MTKEDDRFSTTTVLSLIMNDEAGDARYHLDRLLIDRWQSGKDLEILISLLESEKVRERGLGAFYLGELHGRIEGLDLPAEQMAENSISSCRRAFFEYAIFAHLRDKRTLESLAKGLSDLDAFVRAKVIRSAYYMPKDIFEEFSRLVTAGAGCRKLAFRDPVQDYFWKDRELKRSVRGLSIIRALRAGDDVHKIMADNPGEDSFVMDSILFDRSLSRRSRRRTSQHVQ